MLLWILGTSAACGILVMALTVVCFSSAINWKIELSGPAWDFNRSWASNLTIAGSVLSYAALFGAVGAATKTSPRSVFVLLGALSSGVVISAPLMFLALRRILQALKCSASSCIAFLVGAGVTMSATTLQINLGMSIIWELHIGQGLPLWAAVCIIISAASLLLVTICYAILSASDTLTSAPVVEGATAEWILL